MSSGKIEAIHLCSTRGAEPMPIDSVEAIAGKGLEGDRFFGRVKKGQPRPHDAATLIEAEAIEALMADGIPLNPGETRRNITTRGIDLNALVGRRFNVGAAIFEGYELCDPCLQLEKRTGKKLMTALENRGGLRAYVIQGGTIHIGDTIEASET